MYSCPNGHKYVIADVIINFFFPFYYLKLIWNNYITDIIYGAPLNYFFFIHFYRKKINLIKNKIYIY
jgi:hypothetical protein